MAVSNEFIQAVSKQDVLEIRLILKNSLLLDTSFRKYKEMLAYVERSGINIWMESKPIERKERPWSMDLMNYELTAIINDFSKDHMQYLQDIISYIYRENVVAPQGTDAYDNKQHSLSQENAFKHDQNEAKTSSGNTHLGNGIISEMRQGIQTEIASIDNREKKRQIIKGLSRLTRLLRDARINKNINLSTTDIDNILWDCKLYEDLKEEAKEIMRLCNDLQGGK